MSDLHEESSYSSSDRDDGAVLKVINRKLSNLSSQFTTSPPSIAGSRNIPGDYVSPRKGNSMQLLLQPYKPRRKRSYSVSMSQTDMTMDANNLSVLSNSSCPTIFAVDVPTLFELKDFGCTLQKKRWCGGMKSITLLENVDVRVRGGEILAIMGPSGAGKSILMECATLNQPNNCSVYGKVMLNNIPLTLDLFQEHCYIVHQSELLAPWLTCRETLTYAAMNCIHDTARVYSHVENLMECIGLQACGDVFVGNEFQRGLSGGQKRRLSVCLALVKMPKFIFLDEPTSGLDSASALWTCSYLRKIAGKYGIGVIMTIHQPNTKIFDTFSTLLLLKEGKVAYWGSTYEVENFFRLKGYSLPPKTNIADYLLDILQEANFRNYFLEEKLKLRNKGSDTFRKTVDLATDNEFLKLPSQRTMPSFKKQLWYTMRKEIIIMYRDPMLYTGRCGAFVTFSIFFCISLY